MMVVAHPLYIDPKVDTPHTGHSAGNMFGTMFEAVIGGHTVQISKSYFHKGTAQELTAMVQDWFDTGVVRVSFVEYQGYDVPVIAWGHGGNAVPQYLTNHMSIDGMGVDHLKHIEITASYGQAQGVVGNDTLYTGWNGCFRVVDGFIRGSGSGRVTEVVNKRDASIIVGVDKIAMRAVQVSILDELVGHLSGSDLTPEYDLSAQRLAERDAILENIGGCPERLDRSDYENKCWLAGVEPKQGSCSYAGRYYDHGVGQYDKLTPLKMVEIDLMLAYGRYQTDLEEAAKRERAKIAREQQRMYEESRVKDHLVCNKCRVDGYAGAYPFSTLPGSGVCDDCL